MTAKNPYYLRNRIPIDSDMFFGRKKEMRYRFPVNLLRKWLVARYPLRKVREEI